MTRSVLTPWTDAWHQHLYDLTPVEKVGHMWFKREDFFAPLGPNSINGTKCRQCIWLIHEKAVKEGKTGVVHGAVSGSPQHPMVAAICNHYGLKDIDVTGTQTIINYPMLEMAQKFGAEFVVSNVGYAKTLEAKAEGLVTPELFHLETNITVTGEAEYIAKFHSVSAFQVSNIPDEVDTLIISAGSCNSIVSVLHGLALNPRNIKRVVMIGVGNLGSNNPIYVRDRLVTIGKVHSYDPDFIFDFSFINSLYKKDIQIEHFDAQNGCGEKSCSYCKDGYSTYNELVEAQYENIDFHPRYESKAWNFMLDHSHLFAHINKSKSMFWIIGGKVG